MAALRIATTTVLVAAVAEIERLSVPHYDAASSLWPASPVSRWSGCFPAGPSTEAGGAPAIGVPAVALLSLWEDGRWREGGHAQ
jgi:hypothetical protein